MLAVCSVETRPATMQDVVHMANGAQEAAFTPLGSENYFAGGLALHIDGELLVVAGIHSASPGVGVAWCFCAAPPPQHRARVLYRIRRGFRQLLAEKPYRRIEALVLEDFQTAHYLAQWLGFSYCCTKPLLGPCGETFVEYVYYPGARR
jgi:hypothetical protein